MSKGPLRDNCVGFPPGTDPNHIKHYEEVIDAIEQLYPGAQHFAVFVNDDTGRNFFDVSDAVVAMGMTRLFECAQMAHNVKIGLGPNRGTAP